jgi:hypothetical protein
MNNPAYPATVNEGAARVSAALVGLTIGLAWVVRGTWLLPLLALGFILRAAFGPRYSLIGRLAAALALRLQAPQAPRLVASAPKRFAQVIGATCLTIASVLWVIGFEPAAWILAALVTVFATLEAGAGFCLGCWIYGRLQASGLIGPAVCVDCGRAQSRGAAPAR